MRRAQFSPAAKDDLRGIISYTVWMWGVDQAARYRDDLQAFCNLVAAQPTMGRLREELGPGVHRIEWSRHVIYYRPLRTGVRVLRILHDRMLASRRDMEN